MVLFDYDPQKSPASEHPELELKLKEGDFLTVFGDMDTEGYFEADLNGVRGLVPSLYVDEVEDENDSDRELDELMTTSRSDKINEVPFGKDNKLPVRLQKCFVECLLSDSSCMSKGLYFQSIHFTFNQNRVRYFICSRSNTSMLFLQQACPFSKCF